MPEAMWMRRHRWLWRLLCAHVPAIFAFALLQGNTVFHSALEASVIGVVALCAVSLTSRDRRAASSVLALGLLTSSAIVTHLSGGYIEAHFHFFVVVTLLVLYEDWLPFLLAIAYVLVHHGLASAISPETVFNHEAGIEQPWKWAAIHAGFISALSIVSIVAWRLNEDGRAEARRAQDATECALVAAQHSEELFRNAFENAPFGMVLCAATAQGDARVVRANRALSEITGFQQEDLLDKPFAELTHPDFREAPDNVAAVLRDDAAVICENETSYLHADGHAVPTIVTTSLMRTDAGVPELFISHIQDNTMRKHFEERLAHQALHDALTGLPNRTLFGDRLDQALARTHSKAGMVSVLFIDIDRFKLVNDTHGHSVGDEVLGLIARRLKSVLRQTDTVARFGGDEFAILCEGNGDVAGHAGHIADVIARPFETAGRTIILSASIGIVVADDATVSGEALLRDADAAMYRAKADGGGRRQFFHDVLRREVLQRVEMEDALRHALEHNEFVLHYQPIVDAASGAIESVEALIRWDRPGHPLVFPDQFIGVAEETGLVVAIGEWVLREACHEAFRWERLAGALAPKVAVNISPRQLADPDFALAVTGAVTASGISPARLELELTETAVIEDVDDAAETMGFLGRLGIRLALDDFGMGYSSLGQLQRMPSFDTLKIDRSFTADLSTQPHARALIVAAIEMSRSLGLQAVAEGVETAEQLTYLRSVGCPLAQGYYFSRPVSADAVRSLIRDGHIGTPADPILPATE